MMIETLLIFIASITGYNAKDIVKDKNGNTYYAAIQGKPTPVVTNSMSGGSGDKN